MKAVSKVIDSIGGLLGRPAEREARSTDAETEPQEQSAVSLFRCPDCDAVYVAIDKDACSTCETSVEEAPPAS